MSSDSNLTPFSYAVLVLVGKGGAGPHDLVRMMRRGRIYWAASESQWYAEPKRLERLGYLRSRKEPGRTRPRTHYELTDSGRAALRAWAATPAGFPRIQNEPIVRVLAADLVGAERALEGLRDLRAEIDEIGASLGAAEEEAARLPHRERALRLNHRLARRILDAHRDWLDEVERELRDGGGGDGRAR
jgi:PadR family transcriptional regulator, regulatory protein AphA